MDSNTSTFTVAENMFLGLLVTLNSTAKCYILFPVILITAVNTQYKLYDLCINKYNHEHKNNCDYGDSSIISQIVQICLVHYLENGDAKLVIKNCKLCFSYLGVIIDFLAKILRQCVN